jgi:DNA polymerase I
MCKGFFSMPKFLSNKSGKQTNAIFGFLNKLQELWLKFQPHNVIIVWDSPYNMRKDIDPTYKLRPKVPDYENLIKQVIDFKPKLVDMGVPSIELYGYEADDLIALLAMQDKNKPAIIVTSDQDCYQCLYPEVSMYTGKGEPIDNEFLYGIFGTRNPAIYSLFKALIGCTSDKVKGVPGIGPKKAKDLILKHNLDVDAVYKEIDALGLGNELDLALDLTCLPFRLALFDVFTTPSSLSLAGERTARILCDYDIYNIKPFEFLQRKEG